MDVSAQVPSGVLNRNLGNIAPAPGLSVLAKSGRDFHIKAGSEPRFGGGGLYRTDKVLIINILDYPRGPHRSERLARRLLQCSGTIVQKVCPGESSSGTAV